MDPARERSPGGLLITFEGGEGSGKSTQMELLAEWLRGAGRDVVTAREPGTTATGEAVREFLLETAPGDLAPAAELALFLAARAELAEKVIRPAIEAGSVVLLDRYGDSSVAYQGYGRGLDPAWIEELNRWATGGLEPDRTILIDVPVEEAAGRRGGREPDRLERLDEAFHQRVREGYHEIARNHGDRFRVIKGRRSIGETQELIRDNVRDLLAGPTPAKEGSG